MGVHLPTEQVSVFLHSAAAQPAGVVAYRVGALVLQVCFGEHDDRALLHERLKFVHALIEAAPSDLSSLSVQQLKGEQLACKQSATCLVNFDSYVQKAAAASQARTSLVGMQEVARYHDDLPESFSNI